jgi:CPA1 family monovalent cation:H+ antiporter
VRGINTRCAGEDCAVLALALAVGLPPDVPGRVEIITVSFGVVAFSVFVQGLTVTPLLRAIGEIPPGRGAAKA